jgi:hypothetical protein
MKLDTNAVLDLLDPEALTGEHGQDVHPFAVHAETAAGGRVGFAENASSNRPTACRCPNCSAA